jgi:hypothetical protein
MARQEEILIPEPRAGRPGQGSVAMESKEPDAVRDGSPGDALSVSYALRSSDPTSTRSAG